MATLIRAKDLPSKQAAKSAREAKKTAREERLALREEIRAGGFDTKSQADKDKILLLAARMLGIIDE